MVANVKLIGWGPRVLYLGPALGLTPHRNATAVLAVALDGRLEVADDPADANSEYRSARSVLIPPNTLHHLRATGERMAFLYVDPLSRDLAAIGSRMKEVGPRAAFDLIGEATVVEVLTALAEGRVTVRDGRQTLEELLGIGVPTGIVVSRRPSSACVTNLMNLIRCWNWENALVCLRPVFFICSRRKPACRCDATGCGVAWVRRSRHAGTEAP